MLNAANLEIIREDRKAKQYITDIKFSAEQIAFASGDGRVYIHENVNFGHLITVETSAMYSAVTKVTFSSDGRYLSLSTSSHELFYYSLAESQLISSGMVLRDVVWKDPAVAYSWNTQGVFDRSQSYGVLAVAVNLTAKVVAASYSNGSIRLYRYPCQTAQVLCY